MFGAFFFFFLFRAASTQTSFVVDEECLNYTIYPLQYDVTIKPYVYNGRFFYDCDMTITVIANVPTNIIELEAKHLIIHGESVRVFKGNRDIVNRPRPYSHDEDRGKLIIYLYEPLIPYKGRNTQHYDIKMSFRKEVTEESYGVFLVRYVAENRQQKYLLQTRLSPDYAKYFIPCFDNPRFDSKFKFAVHIPPAERETYNTSLVVSEQFKQDLTPDKTLVITYVPSPQIYLSQVGFHYSQFSNIRAMSQYTNDTIIIWAPAHQIKNCYYILNFGESVLELIRRYSMVNRSLTTEPINVVAVPKDLNGYEVGSWNLLTNNEIRIVNHPQYMSIQQIEAMQFELTQQLTRIWLGNPGEITRTKWREEWFKEGVATYLTYFFLSQYNSRHQNNMQPRLPLDYYGLQMKHTAMGHDWHQTTPALSSFDNELAINIPSRYKELVTMRTAAILWMIENYVGTERFHQALVKYIINRRGMYISLQDFMVSLDHDTVECFIGHNGSRASVVLDSWFKHPGYPVVYVRVLRNRNPNAIQLKQWRFTFSGHHRESNYLIPISYVIQNTSNCFNCYQPWFTTDRHSYTFEENLNGGWIILNRNASGYYRVNYDEWTWKLIAKTLKEDIFFIDELNRAQIVNDAFALFVSGDIDQALAMKILDYLDQERSPVVWEAVMSGYDMLRIEDANCRMTKITYHEWQMFLRKKIAVIYKILTNNVEQHKQTRLFRSQVVNLACSVGYQKCLEYTEHIYKQWRMRNYRVDPDSRQACYYVAYKTKESTLDGNSFNAYENEDKKTAVDKVRKENHFMYKTPVGEPRPENITMTTFEPEPITVSTEKSAFTGSGSKQPAVSFVVTFSIILLPLAMFT